MLGHAATPGGRAGGLPLSLPGAAAETVTARDCPARPATGAKAGLSSTERVISEPELLVLVLLAGDRSLTGSLAGIIESGDRPGFRVAARSRVSLSALAVPGGPPIGQPASAAQLLQLPACGSAHRLSLSAAWPGSVVPLSRLRAGQAGPGVRLAAAGLRVSEALPWPS